MTAGLLEPHPQSYATSLRRARLAVAAIFFVNGAVQANWVSRIPAVQTRLDASNGQLGLALFGLPVGLLLAAPASGWLIARFGSRVVTRTGVLLYCVALPLPALVPDVWLLLLALVVSGLSSGALDVAMNTQAAGVESGYRRPIMASFHGLFSLGGLAGAAAGGGIAASGIGVLAHLLGAALILGALALAASHWLLKSGDRTSNQEPASGAASTPAPTPTSTPSGRARFKARASGPLLALGVVALCVLLGEGAVADWSAVYLDRTIGANAGLAAAGFAAFSLTMAIGRLTGDRATARFGPSRLVRAGGLLGAFGMGLALIAPNPLLAIAGFGCIGLGFSIVFPLVITAAGQSRTLAPGTAIAAVTTAGYIGFLVGPPLIGLTAEATTLRAALAIVAALSLVVALLAGAVSTAHERR